MTGELDFMEEAIYYQKQRSHMKDSLWYLAQRHRTLQDYRQANQNRWNDSASDYANRRYLNPHQEDSEQMMQGLKSQQHSLQQADQQMELANNHAQAVTKLSEDVAQLLEYSQQDLQRSHQNYEYSLENNLAAQEKISEVSRLIAQANSLS